jgi:hypothetical protein
MENHGDTVDTIPGVKQRIVIERDPNHGKITFHLGYKLPVDALTPLLTLDGKAVYIVYDHRGLDPLIMRLGEKLADIDGLQITESGSALISQHKVVITKPKAFADEKVEESVVMTLVNTLDLDPYTVSIKMAPSGLTDFFDMSDSDFFDMPDWSLDPAPPKTSIEE